MFDNINLEQGGPDDVEVTYLFSLAQIGDIVHAFPVDQDENPGDHAFCGVPNVDAESMSEDAFACHDCLEELKRRYPEAFRDTN